MRILVHDFAGHPFQVQLSRWLAGQGHEVVHSFSSGIETPRGALEMRPDDPSNFKIEPVSIGRKIDKYRFRQRLLDEWAYGGEFAALIERERPEIVISGNASPIIQWRGQRAVKRTGGKFFYWLQDIFYFAIEHALAGKNALLTAPLKAAWKWLEFRTIDRSAGIIVISDDFVSLLADQGVRTSLVHVIENWAPSEEIRVGAKSNDWSKAHGLADKFVFMYSGTLGLKHNPSLLSALADAFRNEPDVRVVVISNGAGRDWLEAEKARQKLDNLLLYDFVPFEVLPDSLASGDVQIAILEPFAGVLSVPSKVLTYIAAERPVLAAIPPENLAAKIISRNGLGLNVAPLDEAGFIEAGRRMYGDRQSLQHFSAAEQAYKDQHFDIEKIGRRFLKLFEGAA